MSSLVLPRVTVARILDPQQFQQCVLDWFQIHGRQHLPWQQDKSPYQVWLSEIMLQQTQVATVIPYFIRFTQRFPTLTSLAEANLDEVLSHWSGLGYYARARNLHRCAQIIEKDHAGKFPPHLTQLQQLPGIGRSTAGAILALGFNQAAPILDGNVKRVLIRVHAITDWPGAGAITKKLWALAELYTPEKRTADYTQAMMDLGALICTYRNPQCQQCPLQSHCLAHRTNNPAQFPSLKPRKKLPIRSIQLLILLNSKQEILLEKRPPLGIWGGLWSLPECPCQENAKTFARKHYGCETDNPDQHTRLRHTFSHFHLEIQVVRLLVQTWNPPLMESNRLVWYKGNQIEKKGLAAPVKKLIKEFHKTLCL